MVTTLQYDLFESAPVVVKKSRAKIDNEQSGTFSPNMKLPIHRWFRYSAGFSADWVKNIIDERDAKTVLDPFVGSGTVCIEADKAGVASYGVESHPFIYRLAQGKVSWSANIDNFKQAIADIEDCSRLSNSGSASEIPALLAKCAMNTSSPCELYLAWALCCCQGT